MNLPVISLLALAVAVTLSCTTKINVGVLGMALAWIIGVYLAGRPFAAIAAGFPTTLFLTLVGVTMFFFIAFVFGSIGPKAMAVAAQTGIIVNGIMDKLGMPSVPWQNYGIVFAAHTMVAFTGYLVFGGWRLFSPARSGS